MATNNKLIAAAIDFGTTYSGWAFSFKHEYDTDPTTITSKQWYGGQIVSMKAPTTVLIKPDGKTLDSFGYDAETKYASLVFEGKHKEWFYFRRFKMMLHEKMTMNRNVKLEDETQKSLSAMKVFSLVIWYLKNDLLKTSINRLGTVHVKEDEIMWVLTVPAIWNDVAKQFMREAAIEAGINKSNLLIALEPETASIFCCLLPVERMVEKGGMCYFKPGSKYMVLDAGGGTVDITVHEMMPGGKLKEIHKASGGAWGGTQVDEAFKQFLISLVGAPVFIRFEREKKEDYLDLFRDFEIKKRDTSPDSDTKVTIRFPSSLKEISHEVNEQDLSRSIKQTRYADQVFLSGDKLRIDGSVIKNLFTGVIQNIVSHVKELMKDRKVHGISSILMVGGFSESKMLQDAIKSNFRNVRVIIPQEAGLVVLKGAVVFGHSPDSFAERVCKYTYGVMTSTSFDEKVHDVRNRVEYEDGPYCTNLFSKHVEVGQTVAVNESTEEQSYLPVRENQSSVGFDIYASTKISPMYVTDEGCVKLGRVTVDNLDMTVPFKQRSVLVSMMFGGTEIEVTAKEKRTGNTARVTVNFLG